MKIRWKKNVKIAALTNWAEVWQEQQGISSVKLLENSQWAPLCDCLTAADVLVLRTAGSKWYDAQLCGEFAAL